MRYVILTFPDIVLLAKFYVDYNNAGNKIDNWRLTITGKFSDDQIVRACTRYHALIEVLPSDETD